MSRTHGGVKMTLLIGGMALTFGLGLAQVWSASAGQKGLADQTEIYSIRTTPVARDSYVVEIEMDIKQDCLHILADSKQGRSYDHSILLQPVRVHDQCEDSAKRQTMATTLSRLEAGKHKVNIMLPNGRGHILFLQVFPPLVQDDGVRLGSL